MLLAAIAIAATGVPQVQDPLDELVRRAAATKRLRAVYEMTLSTQPEPSQLKFEYLAPDRMRLELHSSDGESDMWIVGSMLHLRSDMGGRPVAADIDMVALAASHRAVEARIREVAPALTKDWLEHEVAAYPVFQLKWGRDAGSDSATFEWKLGIERKATSPFGWLETARQKGVSWTPDGELLRAETDGCFTVALAKSGLLHELSGRTAKGTMRFVLREAVFDEDPPADRFVVPPTTEKALAAAGDSLRMQRMMFHGSLRLRLLQGFVSARAAAGSDGAAAASVDQAAALALRESLDFLWAQRFVAMQDRFDASIAEIVQQIVAQRRAGLEPDRIATLREQGLKALTDSLRSQLDRILGEVVTKGGDTPSEVAFAALERAALEALFRERVLDVLLARYEAACDDKLR